MCLKLAEESILHLADDPLIIIQSFGMEIGQFEEIL